jgi:hypothetical protein
MIRVIRWLLGFLPIRLVRRSIVSYDQDGLISWHNADFQHHSRFKSAYAAGHATGSWNNSNIEWRAHVGLWAAEVASHLAGDFVECGVNRGGLSRAIVDYLDWNSLGRRFYLLDTFEGFDPRWPAATTKNWEYGETLSAVQATFADFERIKIVKGAVPDTLAEVDSDAIAFLHLDMNTAEPERLSVAYFWPRMVKGGLLLIDDYGWSGHEAQKAAHDEIALANGFSILSLPTGQGIAIKP